MQSYCFFLYLQTLLHSNLLSMKSLVIVDLQKDFYDPQGSMYVAGAEALPARVAAMLPSFDYVFFTLDWHPLDHCSFTAQGGPWPVHCLSHSWGASLPDEVLKAVDPSRQNTFFYHKGVRSYRDEYGAYNDISDNQLKILRRSEQIVVCGLCGDYCVGETARRLIELGLKDRLVMDLSCTRSIDGGAAFDAFIKENDLKTIG